MEGFAEDTDKRRDGGSGCQAEYAILIQRSAVLKNNMYMFLELGSRIYLNATSRTIKLKEFLRFEVVAIKKK